MIRVLFVLLVGVPVCRGLVFSYYYDPEEVDDESDFSDSYNDEIQAPPGLTTVTEAATRIRKRQLEDMRTYKPEERFDVKGALNSIFHGKNAEAADDRPVVLSEVTDSYDYLENSNVLKDKTVETKIPKERIVKWLSTVQIQDWSPVADTDENLGETTSQAEADAVSDTYKLKQRYATNSRIFFYDVQKPDAPRYSRKNDIIAQIRKMVPIFEGDVTRSSSIDVLQSHDVQTYTTADYSDVTQDISMVYLQETTIYSNSEVQAEVRKLVPHWNLTYNLTQNDSPSNIHQGNPGNIPHQNRSDNVQHWNPSDGVPYHNPEDKVRHWNPSDSVLPQNPSNFAQQQNPPRNVQHWNASDSSPQNSNNVQHWNPSDKVQQSSPSNVEHWSPSDKLLNYNPSGNVQNWAPAYNVLHHNPPNDIQKLNPNVLQHQSPPSHVQQWSPSDKLLNYKPPNKVKQGKSSHSSEHNVEHWSPSDQLLNHKPPSNVKWRPSDNVQHKSSSSKIELWSPSDNVQQQNPSSKIKQWSPSDKLLNYKPPNNVKEWKPSDSVQQQNAPINVEHWSPSDKLVNYKPPNNIKQFKPSISVEHSPPSNVEHWSPSDKLLSYKPPNNVKHWKPSDDIASQSPSNNVEHWSPSDKLLNYKPPNNIKQWKPFDNVASQNPSGKVEKWSPSDKLLNNKHPNNIKQFKPSIDVEHSTPSNVEHWSPSDKLLNYKPPNNVKHWKPSDNELQSPPSNVKHWSPDIVQQRNTLSIVEHWTASDDVQSLKSPSNLSETVQWTYTVNEEDLTTQNLMEPDHLWRDDVTNFEGNLTLTTATIDSNSTDVTVEGETHFDSILNVTEFQKVIRQQGRTTRSTTVNVTVASTTEPTTSPRIDIDAILAIISNLTYDYEWNLTEQFNKSLIEHGFPTCGVYKPTPWGPDGIWTATENGTTLKYYNFANSSVVSKCFVCGLKVTEVPRDAYCADAFAGDFLPLMPVDARSRGRIASYRKYCRFLDTQNFVEDPSEPRAIYGRFTGGCAVRWTDITGIYTQRTCRSKYRPLMGKHFASKRMAKLELALVNVEDGCIISPMATLLPVSRGISLYARFHACVCSTNWCNRASPMHSLVHCFIIAIVTCWLACS